MTERAFFDILVYGWFGLAAVVFVLLFFISAPYGRHSRAGWGPTLPNRLGWVLMEAPSPIVFSVCFLLGDNFSPSAFIFLGLWLLHYVYRTAIYPFRLRGGRDKRMPMLVMLMAMVFNSANAYLNGRWLFEFAEPLPASWLTDPRFLIGIALFIAGYAINHHADHILRTLRKPGETGYKIPRGGFYRFVSSPNYFGEVVQWSGWALLTWSLPGAAFALWTFANLAPRAVSHHKWYRETFPDYPASRRAFLPFLW